MFSSDDLKLKSNLENRNFIVYMANNRGEATDYALSIVKNTSVGFGGSATLGELGLFDKLTANGCTVYSHSRVSPENAFEVRKIAANSKWYMASSNALTRSGILINTDGSGNRVAGMISGPENVMLFIGKNKFVNDIESGIARIKSQACPKNARRLNLTTLPCGTTGKCVDCHSPERMCNVTSLIEYKPRMINDFHIVLIDEALGF